MKRQALLLTEILIINEAVHILTYVGVIKALENANLFDKRVSCDGILLIFSSVQQLDCHFDTSDLKYASPNLTEGAFSDSI